MSTDDLGASSAGDSSCHAGSVPSLVVVAALPTSDASGAGACLFVCWDAGGTPTLPTDSVEPVPAHPGVVRPTVAEPASATDVDEVAKRFRAPPPPPPPPPLPMTTPRPVDDLGVDGADADGLPPLELANELRELAAGVCWPPRSWFVANDPRVRPPGESRTVVLGVGVVLVGAPFARPRTEAVELPREPAVFVTAAPRCGWRCPTSLGLA
mmetsp:Transcript_58663/g.169776  ORF Transcript_58663/g.169776 Transcript_58663/m.169776 type:complete len:211 (-) Transcript_58663:1145-1777(-)